MIKKREGKIEKGGKGGTECEEERQVTRDFTLFHSLKHI